MARFPKDMFAALSKDSRTERCNPAPPESVRAGSTILQYTGSRKKLLLRGDAINAAALLDTIPREALEIPEIGLVKAHADLIRTAQLAPERQVIVRRLEENHEDFSSLEQLAALNLVADDYQAALELLLSVKTRVLTPILQIGRSGHAGCFCPARRIPSSG